MQWEYETIQIKPGFWSSRVEAERVKAELNRLGAQGWELVYPVNVGSTAPFVLILKRPLRPTEGSWPPPPADPSA